ncbi:hypothetical protein Q3G72_017309 [Acer saccharum]|nr:hypothetical protein Q3G72_017309 [Acer saccharum]
MNHSLLQFVKKANSLKSFKSIHSHLIISGTINSSDLILNKLLRFYSRFGAIDYGRKLFDEIPQPNEFLWTALIREHVENYRYAEAFYIFDLIVQNSVLDLFMKCGETDFARWAFDEMDEKDVVSLNTMVSGYGNNVASGNMVEARALFDRMPNKDLASRNVMVSGYLDAGDLVGARYVFEAMPFCGIEA